MVKASLTAGNARTCCAAPTCPPASGRRVLVRQSVDPRGLGETGDRKLAEIAPASPADAGEPFRRHDGALGLARNLFQPRRQIYRRPDASEVEPVAAADIAVENPPDMECDTEAKALHC